MLRYGSMIMIKKGPFVNFQHGNSKHSHSNPEVRCFSNNRRTKQSQQGGQIKTPDVRE